MNIEKDDEDETPDKSKIEHEYHDRLKEQILAEEEAIKLSRTIRGVDSKKYKNVEFTAKKRKVSKLSDKEQLAAIRTYQFLIGFIGIVGVIMIFLSVHDPRALWPIFENSIKEMNWLWPGLVLTVAGIVGQIGCQHKHDKISDRIMEDYFAEMRTGRESYTKASAASRKYFARQGK